MAARTEVYLMTDDAHAAAAVAQALNADERLDFGGLCRDTASLLAVLERSPAAIVIVDADPNPMRVVEELEPLANRYLYARFVVLARNPTTDLVMRAMQVGVRHVQAKTSLALELPLSLQRLIPSESAQHGRLGSALTVLSAGGGSGSTTFAVNLAHELHLKSEEQVLLVDLDSHYGAIAIYLELSGQYGVSDILTHAGVIDSHLVRSVAVRHSAGLSALLSPASTNFPDAGAVAPDRLDAAVTACRQGYRYTVVDAPRVPMAVARVLAESSEAVFVVLQPTVKDVRVAKAILASLTAAGIPRQRLRPVLNRCGRHQMVTEAEIRKVLGDMTLGRLSNDYTSAIRGGNYGKVLAEAAPRSALRREVAELATEVAGAYAGNGRHKH